MKSLCLCLIAVITSATAVPSAVENDFQVTRNSRVGLSTNEPCYGIIGGQPTTIEEHPYIVSITYEPSQTQVCGGAIINKNWIVTAGYPLADYRSERANISVRAGSNGSLSGGQKLNISKIIFHEKFNYRYWYDIALIKTSEPINLGKQATPVRLAKTAAKPGSSAQIIGYGGESENATGPGSLHVATVNLQSQHDCEGVHGYLGVTCQCADADGVGPCTGDLGSPLVSKNELIGLYIGGDICNYYYLPEIYSNIASLRPWILWQIKKNSKKHEIESFGSQEFYRYFDDDF